jgi:Mannosyltransferase (PIG-V)
MRSLRCPGSLACEVWLLTRITVLLLVGAAGYTFPKVYTDLKPVPFAERWAVWDFLHFRTIAQYGYGGNPRTGPVVPLEAFFPGFPITLKIVHSVVGYWAPSGLLISLVAGTIAVVVLSRLAEIDNPAGTGQRTVLFFLLAPPAIFLTAGYSEALFLAFALPAWLAARRGNWPLAGFLTAGAAITRVTGIFLAIALVVEFFTARDGRRRWRDLPWLAVPGLPLMVYMGYLYQATGDWVAWSHAQSRGWGRKFVDPVTALVNTWKAGFVHLDGRRTLDFVWMYRLELVAMAIGVMLLVWLLRRRSWGEAIYIFFNLFAFGTSTTYFSVPRATLLWWPLWIGLAAWSLRRPSVKTIYFTVVAPFMVVFVLLFATERWAS